MGMVEGSTATACGAEAAGAGAEEAGAEEAAEEVSEAGSESGCPPVSPAQAAEPADSATTRAAPAQSLRPEAECGMGVKLPFRGIC